jgi:ATP-dependent RNA helicase RhlE
LKSIEREGYATPTPIQSKAIPLLLEGRDLLGCAQTGTGKTAAFAVPILQKLYAQRLPAPRAKRKLDALVLTPTRELALQIAESFRAYGRFTGVRTAVIFGGVSQNPQVAELKSGPEILVATPGRLLDLIGQKLCDLSCISTLVLDESDRMLDMGFIHDVRKIIDLLPKARQTLLFSATLPKEIAALSAKILIDPITVAVTPVSSTVEAIEQSVYFVENTGKSSLLIELLSGREITSALVFSRTKHGANKIQKTLAAAGVSAGAIHGNKSQNARQAALDGLKAGTVRVLVATDIAARGIDVEQLSHVINYDLPNVPETYVHRIGRTGRAGLSGKAISFCSRDERPFLADIQKLIGMEVPPERNPLYPAQPIEPLAAPAPQAGRAGGAVAGYGGAGYGGASSAARRGGDGSGARRGGAGQGARSGGAGQGARNGGISQGAGRRRGGAGVGQGSGFGGGSSFGAFGGAAAMEARVGGGLGAGGGGAGARRGGDGYGARAGGDGQRRQGGSPAQNAGAGQRIDSVKRYGGGASQRRDGVLWSRNSGG